MSALGWTSMHFVDPGVKISGQYYRSVLLQTDLLPGIRQFSEFRIPSRQRTGTQSSRDSSAARTRNSGLHLAFSLATKQSGSQSRRRQNMEIDTREGVQKEDSRYWRVARTHRWRMGAESVIDSAITEWRCRLTACVKARGGHFEHKLWIKLLLAGLYYSVTTFQAEIFHVQGHERLQLHTCACLSCAVRPT